MAKAVTRCLKDRYEDEAFQKVSETKDVLKWRDEECDNYTLIHYAASGNRNTFLEKIFKDKKVVINFQ